MKIATNYGWRAQLARAITLGLLWQAPQLVAAQTPTATWQWATRASSTTAANDYSEGNYIKVDGAGNTFSAGGFHGTMTLGGTSLLSPGDYDAFVAKYTPSGAVAWVRHLDGSSSETVVYGLAVDNSGNSYVSGYYLQGTMVIGSTTLTGGGGFLIKYDPQGTALWVREAGEGFNGIACTAAGEVVAMGSFSGTQVFGSTTLTSASMASSGFLVKYDSQGSVLWARQWEGVSSSAGSLGLDAAGNAYIAADFDGTATFGSITLPGNAGDRDVFVAKYSAAGLPQWALRQPVAGGAARESAWGLATDAAGNTYVTGSSELTTSSTERWFVTQYTPQGTVGWNYFSNIVQNSGLTGITTDATGNVYVSGAVAGSLSIGGLALASSGSNDANVALLSFTPQGAPRWGLSAGTATGTEVALGLTLDGLNNVYVTGVLQGNTTLGALALPQNSASEEQFTAKVSVSTLTATATARAAEPLHLYPNPASGGAVKVRWSALTDAPGQFFVYDALGRLMRADPLPAGRTEAALSIQGLERGIYTLHLKTATATAIGRLVIE
jgi:hypothetical protein